MMVEGNAKVNHAVGGKSGLPSTNFLLLSRKMESCRLMSYQIRSIKPEFVRNIRNTVNKHIILISKDNGKGKGHPCVGTEVLHRPYGPERE